MRVMVFGMANESSKIDGPPTPEQLAAFAAMDGYIEELVAAGVFVAAAGLKNDGDAKRISGTGSRATVMDGPFAESKELVAGFMIWNVKSIDEAVEWAKRNPMIDASGGVEIRPFFEAEDLGDFITEEERANPRTGDRGKLGVA